MSGKTCLVVTSIAGPAGTLEALAAVARRRGVDFIVIGDAASPDDFELDGCDFYGLERQRELPFELAELCPVRHYARKNIGYLLALERGASVVLETDDDSIAYDRFWCSSERRQSVRTVGTNGWTNPYRYFADATIWPRGFPLDEARVEPPPYESLTHDYVDCPIQQGLVDDDPDVDAVYRLLFHLPLRFERRASVALTAGAWCPFNSQNTRWWADAAPLMYLPASCSFRMTDIWRSFVAQRIAWVNGWGVLFHEATVRQDRNGHDLNADFADEVPGYLGNRDICSALESLELEPGLEQLGTNVRLAYELLVDRGWLDELELPLVDAWLADVDRVKAGAPALLQR